MDLYLKNANHISEITTRNYSTSFSIGVRMLAGKYRPAIYSIYGFVRFADEIVDTFHEHNKEDLLRRFREDTYRAIQERVSTNPILHSFQQVVNEYSIDPELIEAFLDSMEMDLHKSSYQPVSFKKYVYGSAEVVGLMCLRVFYHQNNEKYNQLTYYARKLGEAFQKVNFLRDVQADFEERGRMYFPCVNLSNLTQEEKRKIEEDIRYDFSEAYKGIRLLHGGVRLGVYISYAYYLKLFHQITLARPESLLKTRYRVSNLTKLRILATSSMRYAVNLL